MVKNTVLKIIKKEIIKNPYLIKIIGEQTCEVLL